MPPPNQTTCQEGLIDRLSRLLREDDRVLAAWGTFCSFNRASVRRGIDTLVALFNSELALLSQEYHVRFDPEQMTHWKVYMQDTLG